MIIKLKTVCLVLLFIIFFVAGARAMDPKEFNGLENEIAVLVNQNRPQLALIKIENVLEKDLNENQKSSVYFFQGKVYLNLGSFDKAINSFEKVIELGRDKQYSFYQSVFILLELLFKTGDETRLKKNLDNIYNMNLNNAAINKRLGDYYLLINEPVMSYTIFKDFLKTPSKDPNFSLEPYLQSLVESAIKSNKLKDLEQELEKDSSKSPHNLYLLARFYYYANEYDKAYRETEQLVERYPDEQKYRMFLGEILWAKGDRKQAYAQWENLYLQNPDNMNIVRRLGRLYEEHGLLNEAYEKYKLFSDKHPFDLNSLMVASNILHLQGRFKEEIDLYFTRIDSGIFRDSNSAYQIQAKLLRLIHHKELAEYIIGKLSQIEKNRKNIYINKIELTIRVELEQYIESQDLALKLIKVNKDNWNIIENHILSVLRTNRGEVIYKFVLIELLKRKYFPGRENKLLSDLAVTQYRLGEFENAVNTYKSIPGFMNSCKNRIRIAEIYLNKLGRINETRKVLEKCENQTQAKYFLGLLALLENKTDRGIQLLNEGAGTEKWVWLGIGYGLKGEKEKAIEMLDKYITYMPTSDIAPDILSVSRQLEMSMPDDQTAEKLYLKLFLFYQFNQDIRVEEILEKFEGYRESSYYSEAMLIKSRILRDSGEYDHAIRILKDIPDIYYRKDYALFLIGEIYRINKKNPSGSHLYYQRLIMNYPESIWSGEARKIIELLNKQGQT